MDKSLWTRALSLQRVISRAAFSIALSGLGLLGALPAHAGVGLGVTPTFPSSVKQGQIGVQASLQIAWANSAGNIGHGNVVSNITLVPACGSFVASSDCPSVPSDFRQPNVFALSSSATGVGCGSVTNFTISILDAPSGKVGISPGFTLPVGATCTISFTMNVNAVPTLDADSSRSGIQTAVLGAASANDDTTGTPGGGLGSAEVSFPTINTVPGPGGTLGPNGAPPVNLSDSATVAGLVPDANNNPPTGTVTFSLFAPTDPTCVGAPFQSQAVNLTNCIIQPISQLTNCMTSSVFTANLAGVWHWTAVYSGNALNQSVLSGCAMEPVTVNKATPTLQTSPNPTTGTKLSTALGDVADLQGGYFPTGTLTFYLYPPADPTCVGAPVATTGIDQQPPPVATVNGNGTYPTPQNIAKRFITQTGTYHWKVVYSGDANNNGLTSPCAAEPVTVTQPSLTVVKTPDSATIVAGTTATFTIVVTNVGPGVARGAKLTDTLPSGGGVTWVTSSPQCTITGAVGSQVLNCVVGSPTGVGTFDLAENATFTAVVSAPTSLTSCAQMTNTATASATNTNDASDGASIFCHLPATPTLTTTPDPTTGTRLSTALGDSATLSGGDSPTGTLTFALYPPSDPTCVGAPVGTTGPDTQPLPVATVNGNGNYHTPQNIAKRFITQTGTYHWKVTYSGDANNFTVTSPCVDEPVLITQPTLSVAKTPDSGTVTAGDTATFTIVVTNQGPGVARGATLTDNLPSGGGVTWVTSSPQCTISGAVGSQVLNCVVGSASGVGTFDLAQGATFTAVVSAATSLASCTTMTNTASAVAANADQKSDGAQITCQTPVLSLAKSPDNGTVTAGDTATFTIVVTNSGPGTATGVTVTDTLPAGNGVNWQTATAGCTISGAPGTQTLNCSLGSLAQTASTTVVVTAATSLASCTTMTNTASTNASNATSKSDDASIACQTPLLSIAKTPDSGTVTAGSTATFTIVVTNNGPGTATGVTINDPLPAGNGVNWQTATGGCTVTGSVGSQVLNCTAGSLAPTATFTAVVSAATSLASCTTMTNTASTNASNAASQNDGGSIACQTPLLSIAKSPDSATIIAGDTATFTIVVTNNGPGTATGVTINDPLPAGNGVNWQTATGGCTVTGSVGSQVLNCTAGSLAQTATFTAVVSAATSLASCTTMTNTASTSGSNAGSQNDGASITCVTPVLSIAKSPDSATITAGDTATFTIVVTNNGPGTATGVTISDSLPAGGGVSWSTATSGCTVTGAVGTQSLSCTVGSLAQLATFTAVVTAPTVLGKCTTMTNTASTSGSNAASQNDGASITCVTPVLSIAKTPDSATITAGDTATFTIVVTNNGPGTATNVTVSDLLPSGASLTWTTASAGCSITGTGATQTLACSTASLAATGTYTVAASAVTSVGTNTCPASMNNTATASASNAASKNDTGFISCQPPPLGIGGGHFDFDIYYFKSGKYGSQKHIHEYDDEFNVTGVNMLNASDTSFNLVNAIPSTATPFKVLVMNQYLNPAGFLAVGPGTGQTSLKTYGGLASAATAAAALNQTVYTRANVTRLIVNLPNTAFNTFDWWGGADGSVRSGVIPTQTGCVKDVSNAGVSSDPGPNGERQNGALTIQLIKDTTPESALELNQNLGDVRYGWRVKAANFATYVLAEYTLFWHHPNKLCYGDAGWVQNPPLDTSAPGNPQNPAPGSADPKGPIP